jgi:hypothetical protein
VPESIGCSGDPGPEPVVPIGSPFAAWPTETAEVKVEPLVGLEAVGVVVVGVEAVGVEPGVDVEPAVGAEIPVGAVLIVWPEFWLLKAGVAWAGAWLIGFWYGFWNIELGFGRVGVALEPVPLPLLEAEPEALAELPEPPPLASAKVDSDVPASRAAIKSTNFLEVM